MEHCSLSLVQTTRSDRPHRCLLTPRVTAKAVGPACMGQYMADRERSGTMCGMQFGWSQAEHVPNRRVAGCGLAVENTTPVETLDVNTSSVSAHMHSAG